MPAAKACNRSTDENGTAVFPSTAAGATIGKARRRHHGFCAWYLTEAVRPSRRSLRSLLRMRNFRLCHDAIPHPERARPATAGVRLEGRKKPMQPNAGVICRGRHIGRDSPRMMLEIRDLSVSYGGLAALRGVSLAIAEGQFIAIVGPNGAGKTTLFKAISGTVPPGGGTISFGDRDLLAVPPHERAHLGIAHVPEGRQVFA